MLPFDTVLTLVLRDQAGVEIARVDFPIPGDNQRALFVDQIFEDLPPSFIGSLTFETADESHKVATVTVRGNTNARNEALFATLDVIDLADPSDEQVAVLPQVGGAPTLSTQIVLVERSGQQVSGRIRLFDSEGAPLELESGGETSSEFAYELPNWEPSSRRREFSHGPPPRTLAFLWTLSRHSPEWPWPATTTRKQK